VNELRALPPKLQGGHPTDDFTALTRRHRREIHVHCYRMLASFDEAEDAVQETFLRAWRSADGFVGESIRPWLYRIAPNVCLDALRSRSRRARAMVVTEVPWLQPYPDLLLDEIPATDDEPDALVVARETIELAFLVAVQILPPRQRAVLLLRDVLGMSASETAELLEASVAATNSALQRARATLQEHLPSHRAEWRAQAPSDDELSPYPKANSGSLPSPALIGC
jgi:RNA polymerase sigma-70 factor (ECF subfamily)